MIRHVLSSIHFARAFAAYQTRDFVRARHHLNSYFRITPKPKPSIMAFDATLLIREMKSANAHKRFAEAIDGLGEITSDNHLYIDEYCKYYMCLYENLESGTPNPCDDHRIRALSLQPSAFMKKLLPLRHPEAYKSEKHFPTST